MCVHCVHARATRHNGLFLFLAQAGGFTFAAETDGCNQIKLLKAVAKVGAENNVLSRLALYEEWDSADSALLCGVHRADKELLQKHLGFDAGSGKLMALQGERAAVEGFSLLAEDHVPGSSTDTSNPNPDPNPSPNPNPSPSPSPNPNPNPDPDH